MTREARRLRVIRADMEPRAWSQAKTARASGLALYRYWQLENGDGPGPSSEERHAVAKALGVTVGDIAWPEIVAVASRA